GMATYFFLVGLKLIGTVRTVLLYSTTSVFGVIFAAVFLQENITLPNVFSIILVSAGLYILRDRLGRNEKNYGKAESESELPNFHKLCDNCNHHGCCTGLANPIVFSHDLADLEAIGKSGDEFLHEVKINGKNAKVIKKKNNSNVCVFYDEDKRICSIYQNRPFDCRAYPFDICLIDNKYRWIVYSCNPDADWTWSEKYLQMLENDVQFNEVIEKIDAFAIASLAVLEKSQVPFIVLREVKH
ncbi:MAG: YkgJ family cysteine cluster protein, partial [Nitrosopumilaceae archaeon]